MKSSIQRQMELFSAALEHPAGPERDAFLAQACAGDDALLACVRTLLASHTGAGSFLAQPAGPVGPTGTHLLPATEKPGDKIGRYKLLQQIGEGGCGTVYMAEQEAPVRRRVALKVIRLGMDTRSVVARFEAERQALALMDHPNIAKVFDGGATESGRPYFVMELVRGIKITEYCDQAHLSTEERLQLFIQVCQAVQHAHQKGVIHRDIKPSNILVTVNDGVAVPKVIDFGIAKATDQRLTDKSYFTEFHAFIGTPAYTSPEQAEMSSLDIDTRSDIYSLGVLLYEMLTGQTPFPAERLLQSGLDEMRRIIREEEPPRPSTCLTTLGLAEATDLSQKRQAKIPQLASAVQGDLDWIVMKALEKDRTRRYATSLELAADLQRHLNNEAVLARPPSVLYKFQRTVRRNKGAFAAAAAVFLALLTGLGFTAWQAMEARQARESERSARLRAEEQSQRVEASEAEFRELHYAAAMNLAEQAWQQNNPSRVKELLRETAAYPNCGFEWYYLQRLLHTELLTVYPESQVLAVAVSPDGQVFATGDSASCIKLWDAATGQELRVLKGHPEWLEEAKRAGWRSQNIILSMVFSPDSRRLVSCGRDSVPKVWEVATGRELVALVGHARSVNSVAFAPNGHTIATGSDDRTLRFWNAESGLEIARFETKGPVTCVAFSADGQYVASAGGAGSTTAWEISSRRECDEFKARGHSAHSLAFFPDGKRIAIADRSAAKVLDAETGAELAVLKKARDINALAVSPDGRRVLVVGDEGHASIFDAATGESLLVLKGHRRGIRSGAFFPDGGRVLTGSWDSTARIWDAFASREFVELKGNIGPVASLGFSPDNLRIISGGADGIARVWNLTTGTELLHLADDEEAVSFASFSPDGRFILTVGKDKKLIIWNGNNGKQQLTLPTSNGASAAAFSPDGNQIAVADGDLIRIVETMSGKELFTVSGVEHGISDISFSPDGKLIAFLGFDRELRFLDSVTGAELSRISGLNVYYAFDLSPDGSKAITGSVDDSARVWDVRSGRQLLSLRGHASDVKGVAFSLDGGRAITTGQDGTLRMWDSTSGRNLLSVQAHETPITALAVSHDGFRIATADSKGSIRIWGAASATELANWHRHEGASKEQ